MTWFRRYGIPGMYFVALIALWGKALYPCQFYALIKSNNVDALAALLAVAFLPIGYLLSIIQQVIYLLFPPQALRLGATTKAVVKAGVFDRQSFNNKTQATLEAEACLLELAPKCMNQGQRCETTVERSRFLQEWIRSRNDVMAINAALIVAGIMAPLIMWLVPRYLEVERQTDSRWWWLALIVTCVISAISFVSWCVMRHEVVTVDAGIYKMLEGKSPSTLKFKQKGKS